MFTTFRLSWFSFLLTILLLPIASPGDEWPQWRGPHRDGIWRETGILKTFDQPKIALRWSVPISSGYSGPTVADGRVYVSDRVEKPKEIERIHCFEWSTGKKLWSTGYDCPYQKISYRAGPRASVLIDEGRAYSLGSMGHLYCLDAKSGDVIWKKDLDSIYGIRMPSWGVAASPIIESGLVIVKAGCKGNACLLAFDKKTGDERWKALPDNITYSAPIVIDHAGRRVLICWAAERIVGLEPATGKPLWDFEYPPIKWPIAISDPVPHGDLVVFSEAHKGTLLLRLGRDVQSIEKVWQRSGEYESRDNDALHCLQSTPLVKDGHIYGVDGYGVLRCLDLETGKQLWQTEGVVQRNRWATAHMVRNGNRVWIFNERGELIIARLTPRGYEEISRAKLLEPTMQQLRRRDGVTWSHPAFAHKHVFARNDRVLVCADLSAKPD